MRLAFVSGGAQDIMPTKTGTAMAVPAVVVPMGLLDTQKVNVQSPTVT